MKYLLSEKEYNDIKNESKSVIEELTNENKDLKRRINNIRTALESILYTKNVEENEDNIRDYWTNIFIDLDID